MKYYIKKTVKLNNIYNVRNMSIKFIFIKLNSVAYIAYINIIRQNILIKKIQRSKNEMYAKTFIKYSILNVSKNK